VPLSTKTLFYGGTCGAGQKLNSGALSDWSIYLEGTRLSTNPASHGFRHVIVGSGQSFVDKMNAPRTTSFQLSYIWSWLYQYYVLASSHNIDPHAAIQHAVPLPAPGLPSPVSEQKGQKRAHACTQRECRWWQPCRP